MRHRHRPKWIVTGSSNPLPEDTQTTVHAQLVARPTLVIIYDDQLVAHDPEQKMSSIRFRSPHPILGYPESNKGRSQGPATMAASQHYADSGSHPMAKLGAMVWDKLPPSHLPCLSSKVPLTSAANGRPARFGCYLTTWTDCPIRAGRFGLENSSGLPLILPCHLVVWAGQKQENTSLRRQPTLHLCLSALSNTKDSLLFQRSF